MPSTKHHRREAPILAAAKPTEVPDVTFNFVSQNQSFFRALPLYAGGLGIASLLVNRIVAGVRKPITL